MALVLSIGAFVFVGREAKAEQVTQAQQQHTTAIQHTVVVDGQVAETEVGTPSGEVPTGGTSPTNTSPVGPAPLVGSPSPGNSSQQVDPAPSGDSPSSVDTVTQASEPLSEPTPRSDPMPSVETGTAPPIDSSSIPEPAPQLDLAPPIDPAALASEETSAQGPVFADSGQEEPYPLSSLGTETSSAMESLESNASVPGNLADGSPSRSAEGESSTGALLVNLFSGGEAGLAPVGGREDSGSPSGETGQPSNGTPQPSAPITPPLTPPVGGSSFSLSGGQVGPGGVAPLLLCVLILGLVLLRRDGKLSRAFCESPKPSSVLLLPLERPG